MPQNGFSMCKPWRGHLLEVHFVHEDRLDGVLGLMLTIAESKKIGVDNRKQRGTITGCTVAKV